MKKIFFLKKWKNIFFSFSALGRNETKKMDKTRPALTNWIFLEGWFENLKKRFFWKIEDVYARYGLDTSLGMWSLTQTRSLTLMTAFLASETKIQILCRPALGRPWVGLGRNEIFHKNWNSISEYQKRFHSTNIGGWVKHNNVYKSRKSNFRLLDVKSLKKHAENAEKAQLKSFHF